MGQKSYSVMSYSVIQVVQRNKFISNFVLVAPWLRNLPTTGFQLERSCFMRRWKRQTLLFFFLNLWRRYICAVFSLQEKSLTKTQQSYKRRRMALFRESFLISSTLERAHQPTARSTVVQNLENRHSQKSWNM